MKNKLLILSLFLLTGCNFNISSYNSLTKHSSQTSSSTVALSSPVSSSTEEVNSSIASSSSSSSSSSSTSSSVISSSSSTYTYEPVQYIKVDDNPINIDPYVGLSHDEFYRNYTEATSYEDALLRTKYGFISGSIDYNSNLHESNTIYEGKDFLKFGNYTYGINSNNEVVSYNINYTNGSSKTIYKGAGYVALEEVAAYILAFGEVPANSNYNKNKTGQSQSIAKWGKYGRVNVGKYSNDVVKYPNEPELPTKDSNGKKYQYTETDIGLAIYNNGSKITRGTYRICFTSSYLDGSKITDVRERFVFFTGNHYYDFEEYLNYYGGWGNKFGYETGNNVSPTPYIKAKIVDKNSLKVSL